MKKSKDSAPTMDRSKPTQDYIKGNKKGGGKKPALKTTDSKPVAPRAKTFC